MRSHYFHDRERRRGRADGRRAGASTSAVTQRVEDLYLAADVLVTDYSSAMFDYAVLDRPIVVYAPDWDAYRLARGVYFDVTARAAGRGRHRPSPSCSTCSAPARCARTRRTGPGGSSGSRFCALDDGQAAERVVRRVFLGEPDDGHGAERRVAS